jgi:hypothetical protein
MSSGADISALYREFTDALTEVLAENAVGPARAADSRGLALRSRSTRTTTSLDIFWQSKPHSKIGKQCKTSVARTGTRSWGKLPLTTREFTRPSRALRFTVLYFQVASLEAAPRRCPLCPRKPPNSRRLGRSDSCHNPTCRLT